MPKAHIVASRYLPGADHTSMIRTLRPAALLAALLPTAPLLAQCPGCVIDNTCTVSPAFPALCPLQPPDATAGEPYAADITFWLPANFTDPGTGFTVSFQQMTITGVSGLPFGLALETNEPTGIYYPQQNEYGCARICGTPLGPGTFTITISILAGVEFSGIPINAPQQFEIILNVLPGAGGNTGFSFSPTTGCGSAEVSFQALIDAAPQPTGWVWDFGNGSTSTDISPPVQTYDTPGTYTVTLETTISGYFLNSVAVTSVNNNWCGDIEEPFCNCGTPIIGTCPDLYFTLSDPNGVVYASNTIDGVTSAAWSGLAIPLENPPYTLTIWDEDVVSANDNLGTYLMMLAPGPQSFNVAGGTAGSVTLSLQVLQQFNDTDVVVVFAAPAPVVVENGGQLCVEDPGDLVAITWLLGGEEVETLTGACITPTGPGLWQAVGTNGFGCTGTSAPTVVCPSVTITRTGPVLSVPDGFLTYAWTFNGEPLIGANGAQLTTIGDGLYTVTVTGENDCVITADFVLNTIGIDETHGAGEGLWIHPNPARDLFTLRGEGFSGMAVRIELLDATGRPLHSEQQALVGGAFQVALMPALAPGGYLVRVTDGERVRTGRVVLL